MHLVPVLPPLPGESIISWFGRVARYHADMSSHDFLSIIQLSREDLVHATDYCIERLTVLTGIGPSRLLEGGYRSEGSRVFRHRAETFTSHFASRKHTTYCAACLLEDRDPYGSSLGLRVGYVNWFFRPIRVCKRHGHVLVRRSHKHYSEQFQDLEIVAPDDRQLEREAVEAVRLKVSGLQTYTERRFNGALGPSWLDGQMIDQAAKACEMLGACLEYGAHCNLRVLSMEQWNTAGAAGFEAAADGPSGIMEALERIRRSSEAVFCTGGPQAAFGRLYQWLQFSKSSRDPGPISDVLREHILDSMAIDPGTDLLGKRVLERRRHSVGSLSDATGLHTRTLNRALTRAGILEGGDENRVDERASFDAVAGEALAHRILNSVPINHIPNYLNCNRLQAEGLVKAGILSKLVPESGRGGVLTNVAMEDLEDFLDRFRACGHPVKNVGPVFMDVIAAAEVARWPVIDIVRLILDGALPDVQLLPRSHRFRSVLVDPDQVKRAMSLREAQWGLSSPEVAQRLGIFTSGVTHLRKTQDRDGRPFLRPIETSNWRGTIHHHFAPEEVARFSREHVKLGDLACERGMSPRTMSKALAEADIQPIVRRPLLNAAYYRRADL